MTRTYIAAFLACALTLTQWSPARPARFDSAMGTLHVRVVGGDNGKGRLIGGGALVEIRGTSRGGRRFHAFRRTGPYGNVYFHVPAGEYSISARGARGGRGGSGSAVSPHATSTTLVRIGGSGRLYLRHHKYGLGLLRHDGFANDHPALRPGFSPDTSSAHREAGKNKKKKGQDQ